MNDGNYRYELWITDGLGGRRRMVATDDTLGGIKQIARLFWGPRRGQHRLASIEYIALHSRGRTERSWVRDQATDEWIDLQTSKRSRP